MNVLRTPDERVKSSSWLTCQWVWPCAAPMTRIGVFAASRARALPVTTTAPPPSTRRQMSWRWNGVTSVIVTVPASASKVHRAVGITSAVVRSMTSQ